MLCCISTDSGVELLSKVAPKVRADWFENQFLGRLLVAIQGDIKDGGPTHIGVAQRFQSMVRDDLDDPWSYMFDVWDDNRASSATLEWQVSNLKEWFVVRRLSGRIREVQGDDLATMGAISSAIEDLGGDLEKAKRLISREESLDCLADQVQRYLRFATEQGTRVPTGTKLDKALGGGLERGTVTIVAARPHVGKTSFAYTLVRNACFDRPHRALVVQLEMSERMCVGQLLHCCSRSPISFEDLSGHEVARSTFDLASARYEATLERLTEDDRVELRHNLRSCSQLRQHLNDLGERGLTPDLVVVDYLQKMRPDRDDRGLPREQQVSAISRELCAMAQDYDVAMVALAQFRRPDGKSSKEVRMEDIRESGAVEQDADVILGIERDPLDDTDECYIVILKNRLSRHLGRVPFLYRRNLRSFEDA